MVKTRHIYESDERKESTGPQTFRDQGHPFVDGNKRIAFALGDIVLRENGYRFNVGNDEIIEFLLSLVKREFELEGVEDG